MTILGNICLGLAAFLYLLPLQLVAHETPKRNDGGLFWGAVFVLVPLWVLLTGALCAVTAWGGFDWLTSTRSPQYMLVLATGVAMFVVTAFSLLGKFEPASQMPVSSRWLAGWAVQVFPLVAIGFCLLSLNPKLAESIPLSVVRGPLIAVAAVSLLVSGGLLIEWFVSAQKRQLARVEEAVVSDNKRNRDVMARVETLRTVEDFPELLGFANRFEEPPIRELAIKKAQAHPEFTAALIKALTENASSSALVYLDACDPPDKPTLAEPVRAAILRLAAHVRDAIPRTHTLYADQFDWDTRLILSVAEKFQDQGMDYLPAIREFRAALKEPHSRKIKFNAETRLDDWLVRQEKSRKTKSSKP